MEGNFEEWRMSKVFSGNARWAASSAQLPPRMRSRIEHEFHVHAIATALRIFCADAEKFCRVRKPS
jgi:hypothetical protein